MSLSLSNFKTKWHNDRMPGSTLIKMMPLKWVSTKGDKEPIKTVWFNFNLWNILDAHKPNFTVSYGS